MISTDKELLSFLKNFVKNLKQKPIYQILLIILVGFLFIVFFALKLKFFMILFGLLFVLSLSTLVFLRPFYGIIIYIIFLPFHAFLVTIARNFLQLSDLEFSIFSAWKEIILIVLFLRVVFNIFKTKRFPFKLYLIDKLIFAFFFVAILSVFIGKVNLAQAIWGAKYDLEFLALYLVIRSIFVSKEQVKKVIKIFIVVSVICALFGFLQIFILPKSFFVKLGYSPTPVSKRFDLEGKIPAVWNDFGLDRAFSFFSGPNNFGYFLIVSIIILISLALYQKNQKLKNVLMILAILEAFVLAQTFSRSAWLGLAISLLILIILAFKKKEFKVALLIVLLGFTMIGSIFTRANILEREWSEKVFLHGHIRKGQISGSTAAHIKSYNSAFKIIKEHPFGVGMGRVNAAATRFKGDKYSVESWYLQIALEMGFLGLLCFLAIPISYMVNLYHNFRNKIYQISLYQGLVCGMFLTMLAMCLASIFIPAWFDTSNTLIFWILAAIAFSLKENILFQNLEFKVKS